MSSPKKEILWEAPKKLSIRRGRLYERMERATLAGGAIVTIGVFVGLWMAGAVDASWNSIAEFLGFLALLALVVVYAFLHPAPELWEKYPIVRSDALELPNRALISFELTLTIPWAEMKDLKVEHPKRETGPNGDPTGPDLRITVTTSDGRALVYNYEGEQDLPWTVHDPLAKALGDAWEQHRRPDSA